MDLISRRIFESTTVTTAYMSTILKLLSYLSFPLVYFLKGLKAFLQLSTCSTPYINYEQIIHNSECTGRLAVWADDSYRRSM